jgi:hypothetical protein
LPRDGKPATIDEFWIPDFGFRIFPEFTAKSLGGAIGLPPGGSSNPNPLFPAMIISR